MFDDIYKNKKVLITGNTGFKGSWLTIWLLKLGANIIGYSKDVPTSPSIFKTLELEKKIIHYKADVRNLFMLKEIVTKEKPDFIFHLAAEAIVSKSHENPLEAISSNVMGTANVLEALRISNHHCKAIIITSDKAYDNVEHVWGYKENDKIGGKDIYSGSKGAAEVVINAYLHSFFKKNECNVKLAIGRAGNVIGGGDWAADRVVADCMRAWSTGKIVQIRSPSATRPWQHVLEPLSGYLALGAKLAKNHNLHGEAFNFGPRAEQNHSVAQLIQDLSKYWHFDDGKNAYEITDNIFFDEAKLLKLNCDKALYHLKWQANLEYFQTVKFTSEWYYKFYKTDYDGLEHTLSQIDEYILIAKTQNLSWTV